MGKDMQKTVVITGCSSGIGLVAAQDLQARGYRVIAACRKPEDVERMRAQGFIAVTLDLDDAASVDRAADDILALTAIACSRCSTTAASASTVRCARCRASSWSSSSRPTSSAPIS